ncbi:Glutamate 5-kinase / RNA-binding C-terminal domain PUA, partial [hydrothermal vent metagenome]
TLVKQGRKVAIVSSGAVTIGARRLEVGRRNLSIPVKQAAAAVGQSDLIGLWAKSLGAEGLKVGQILLTHDDLANRRRFLNARNTINALFDFGFTPVINENDTVAVHEIKFGDNDTLSARVTTLIEAGLLAVLSDVDGLYSSDPRLDRNARKVDVVDKVDDSILAMAKDSSTRTGLGGMASKVRAADEAARIGAATIIIPGAKENSLLDALAGEPIGTFFFPHKDKMSGKKHWIEYTLKSQGAIVVDKGAKDALILNGRSLLASGITDVKGDFESGEAVDIVGPDGETIAKGLVNYHSFELARIMGRKSGEIEEILGYKIYDEVMHRNDMVFSR